MLALSLLYHGCVHCHRRSLRASTRPPRPLQAQGFSSVQRVRRTLPSTPTRFSPTTTTTNTTSLPAAAHLSPRRLSSKCLFADTFLAGSPLGTSAPPASVVETPQQTLGRAHPLRGWWNSRSSLTGITHFARSSANGGRMGTAVMIPRCRCLRHQ